MNLFVEVVIVESVLCVDDDCDLLSGKSEQTQEPELRDEKQFPNGTVVGKYTYLDNEGNPIQVKYYADEASYG